MRTRCQQSAPWELTEVSPICGRHDSDMGSIGRMARSGRLIQHNSPVEERDSTSVALTLTLVLAAVSAATTIMTTVAPWWLTCLVTLGLLALSLWLAIKYARQARRWIELLDSKVNRKARSIAAVIALHEPIPPPPVLSVTDQQSASSAQKILHA